MANKATTIHRLKVNLRAVKPTIWRRIEVRSDTKLSELSDMLEAAMGWFGGHLHSFDADGVSYEMPDEDGDEEAIDERTVRLAEVLPAVKSTMRWDYDFGDGWEHDIVVEAIEPVSSDTAYPICIDGERACPPEDCGGPHSYGTLLAATNDPTHPQHKQLIEWLPPDFDPEAFDIDETTLEMRSPRPLDER